MKRLFLGLEPNHVVRGRLTEVQERLREVATRQGVRFVRPEKIHLTLVFLGDLPDESVDVIDTLCASVPGRHLAPHLTAKGLGGFPDLRRPKVLWVGLEGDLERLGALQVDLADAVSGHAKQEGREYSPHLTMARISPGSKEVGRLVTPIAQELGEESIASWIPADVVLFESTPDGRYEGLRRWNFASESS